MKHDKIVLLSNHHIARPLLSVLPEVKQRNMRLQQWDERHGISRRQLSIQSGEWRGVKVRDVLCSTADIPSNLQFVTQAANGKKATISRNVRACFCTMSEFCIQRTSRRRFLSKITKIKGELDTRVGVCLFRACDMRLRFGRLPFSMLSGQRFAI